MRTDFNLNKQQYKQNFGMSAEITDKALINLKTRFMSKADIDRFEKVINHFNEKGDFINGTLDEINGNLTASIFSTGRYSETKYESTFSRLCRSPIHFIESWAKRADKVEEKLRNDVKLEEITHNLQK